MSLKKKISILFLGLVLLSGCQAETNESMPLTSLEQKEGVMSRIRKPAVAGQFYPADEAELSEMIDGYLDEAALHMPDFPGKPRVLVLPHAGYIYSGQVAAYGFQSLAGQDYDTAIVVSVSHVAYFDGIHVYDGDGYETPLGVVPIHQGKVAQLLAASDRFAYFAQAENGDHTVEVMVPFLQQVLGDSFSLVPIILSGDSESDISVLASALADVTDSKTIIIASSDLTHYPDYEDSVYADTKTIDSILSGDPDQLASAIAALEAEGLANVSTCACGEYGIRAVMQYARTAGGMTATKLFQANSGDTELGDHSRVVGYGAVLFSKEVSAEELEAEEAGLSDIPFTGDEVLDNTERHEALQIARETLDSYVRDGKIPEFTPEHAIFYEELGAFVTLNSHDNLRGCIGRFEPDEGLWKVLRDMAVAAAAYDTRFYPVNADELDDIELEISVLSPMTRINDPFTEIKVGHHGVYVKQDSRSGTYLPQVATDNGWDLETFMNSLCGQKAGIGEDAWKTGEAEIYIYSAQVFGE